MKAYLLIFAPVFLLPCWTMPAGKSKSGSSAHQNFDPIPLTMVPGAVDDMYCGCTEAMEKKVEEEYFKKENEGTFKIAWENAEECSREHEDPQNEALTQKQLQAICVYTSNDIYAEFNNAVRTGRSTYGSSFKFHYLHFWLTSAVQILNNNDHCYSTYRRTNLEFTGNINDIIRFGIFASSSKKPNLKHFGNKTCFNIKTCSGAYLKHYSEFSNEEEVLIPPYETFKITNIIKGQGKFPDLSDCEVVFILESAGAKSELNCEAAY